MKILICKDLFAFGKTVKSHLEKLGHSVFKVEYFEKTLDNIQVYEESGIEILLCREETLKATKSKIEKLIESCPHVLIILISENTPDYSVLDWLPQRNLYGYFRRPYSLVDLELAIRNTSEMMACRCTKNAYCLTVNEELSQ